MTAPGVIPLSEARATPSPPVLRRVVAHLAAGNLAVLPTETRYALCADATSESAVARTRLTKGRSDALPFSVFTDRVERLADWRIRIPPLARVLIEAFWPGPLTLILPSGGRIFRHLGTADTVGVRFSPIPVINQAVARLGRPLLATSANPSGAELDSRAENRWLARLAADGEILWVRPHRYHRRPVSTVVDCAAARPRILRHGAISARRIDAALRAGRGRNPQLSLSRRRR